MRRWGAISFGRKTDRGEQLLALVEALRARGLSLAGFVQRAVRIEGLDRATELIRLARPESIRLGESGKKILSEDGCSFVFRPEAFAAGEAWVKEDAPLAQVLILHEVGKLELTGGGHAACVERALSMDGPLVLLCASGERLEKVIEQFAPSEEPSAFLELPASREELERFLSSLSGVLAKGRDLTQR